MEPLVDPAPYRPRPDQRRQGLLLKEFAHRVGDPNTGGTNKRPIVTAYRQDALRCAAVLAANWTDQAADVGKAAGVPKATGSCIATSTAGSDGSIAASTSFRPRVQASRRTRTCSTPGEDRA